MRIKKFLALGMTCCLFMVTPVQSIAAPLETQTDLLVQDQNSFRDLMDIIILGASCEISIADFPWRAEEIL